MNEHTLNDLQKQIHTLEQRIADGDERLRTMIQHNADGILVVDKEGRIQFCNPAAEQLFDQPAERLIGQYFEFPLILDDNTEVNIVNGHTGTTVIAEMRAVEIIWEGATAHLVSLRDITARKLLDGERIEREKIAVTLAKEREMRALKDRFLTMMTHELRTPLALIRLSYDMMKQYSARSSEEERQGYLDNIRVQVDHLTDVIHEVMTISRAENENDDFMPEPTDLIAYCQHLVEEFHGSYFQSHPLTFGSDQNSVHGIIDRRLMRQAINHLLSNSFKYSPPDSPIVLQLSADTHAVRIAVQDHGIGVPTDDLPRLFEPFHRGSNVDTIPGTGLGLAIVQQVVKAHKGRIEVVSTINVGTTVTLVLPMLSD